MGHSRPKITDEHIEQINKLLTENPDWNRTKLSKELCIKWGWQSSVGQIKDLSCRDLLRDLEKAEKIKLPPLQRGTRRIGGGADKINLIEHCTEHVETSLRNLTPLKVEITNKKEDLIEFKSYIAQYHYLGYDRSIGENMKYIIKSDSGIPLACMMFGSASWKCKPRDEFIGWSNDERERGLHLLTNNVRNLIFPWVRVPYLASHTLSLISRRLSNDWQVKYGHPIYLLETFVEKLRFRGVSYLAANWIHVGETTGRGRNSKSTRPTLPIKDIWLYPLRGDFRSKITGRST
jgi:hypothetical protein